MSECVQWQGRIRPDGYGTLGVHLAHRRVWEEANGPIPQGMTLDHICHDPAVCRLGVRCPHRACVNLDHLAVVTADANRRRKSGPGALVTHCPRGHEYAGDNLKVYGGKRHCRECRRAGQARRKAARADMVDAVGSGFTALTGAGQDRSVSVLKRRVA